MPEQARTTRVAIVHRDSRGIIHGTYTHSEETLVDAHENMAAVRRLSNGQPALLVIDSRALKQMSPDVRTYYTSAAMVPLIRALAIIVESPASRLFGSIFLRFQTSTVPTRLFTDTTRAERWLLTYAGRTRV